MTFPMNDDTVVPFPVGATLAVNEIYGPVLQGEGPDTGRPMVFLRMAGCNLDCSWCDTPYSWDWDRYDVAKERHKLPITVLTRQVLALVGTTAGLCITGGEPLIQATGLVAVVEELPAFTYVAVETNGTRMPHTELAKYVDRHVVSPKLSNSGIEYDKRVRQEVLAAWGREPGTVAKFVVKGMRDMDEVSDIVAIMGLQPPDVWVMPEGTDPDIIIDTARMIEHEVVARGWNLTLRNQVLLHGNEREV